jgi:hypothetical protein
MDCPFSNSVINQQDAHMRHNTLTQLNPDSGMVQHHPGCTQLLDEHAMKPAE